MFNKSIAYRLSIYISIAVITVFLIFILIAYLFNNSILKSNIENKAMGMGYQSMIMGERQLVSTKEITHNIADMVMYFAQHNDVEILISKLMTKYHFLNAIHINIDSVVPNIEYHNYYCYRDKDSLLFWRGNELVFHCGKEKSIFLEVMNEKNSVWTEEFTCRKNEQLVVSYYVPIVIQDDNGVYMQIGSVISELTLLELADTINSIKIGESGYAFLVNKEGTYLTHPNKELILKKNLFNISAHEYQVTQNGIKNLLDNRLSGSTIAYPEYLNHEKCWIHYTPMKETDWTLIFVVPYNELFVPLYLIVLRMLFFAILGILVIFFIVTYISNKLIQPLSTVTRQLKKFSSSAGSSESNTKNEVELVSSSLEYLKDWYEKFKIDLTHEEKLNSQRRQDLMEASEIQMSLINSDFSIFKNNNDFDLFAVYHPARIVSGDLYDFILLDKENLYFTIGDVSGKGLSAAFFMSVAQTLLKSNSKYRSPGKIIAHTNNELYTNNQHQFFLTCFTGVLNLKTGNLKYCNAAHTASLVLSKNGELCELNNSHGMPLGLYPNRNYPESETIIKPGDSIILYSDGVTEMQDNEKQHYGSERFYEILKKSADSDPENTIQNIENDLKTFRGTASQSDDVTIMIVKFKQ
jgi:sigma-B regulation protein RsbU (phosphoserine phosphatase)